MLTQISHKLMTKMWKEDSIPHLQRHILHYSGNSFVLLFVEDMPLETRCRIFFQHDRKFHILISLLESALRKPLVWSLWSSNFATKISGHNPLHLFMGSNERDDVQEQGTHERNSFTRLWMLLLEYENTPKWFNIHWTVVWNKQGCAKKTVVHILICCK
jgi:hypothetical protein